MREIIGENIKKFRKNKKLTQQNLADILEISIHAIRKYENNSREPKIEMIYSIANALDVPVVDILGLTTKTQS